MHWDNFEAITRDLFSHKVSIIIKHAIRKRTHGEIIKLMHKRNNNDKCLAYIDDKLWEHAMLYETNKSTRDEWIVKLIKSLKVLTYSRLKISISDRQ